MKMNTIAMKMMGLALALGLSGFATVSHAADGAKIATVDIEKAIKATSAGQKMSKELQGEFEKKKSDFQKRDGDLRKMFEDLEKKKSLLTDEARAKKAGELQQEQMKFQKEVAESQATIQKKERDLLEPIAKKMEEIIEKVAKEGGYTAILDKRAILWGAKSADLTDDIVKEFEKSAKK
jgi:outer membrane protein